MGGGATRRLQSESCGVGPGRKGAWRSFCSWAGATEDERKMWSRTKKRTSPKSRVASDPPAHGSLETVQPIPTFYVLNGYSIQGREEE